VNRLVMLTMVFLGCCLVGGCGLLGHKPAGASAQQATGAQTKVRTGSSKVAESMPKIDVTKNVAAAESSVKSGAEPDVIHLGKDGETPHQRINESSPGTGQFIAPPGPAPSIDEAGEVSINVEAMPIPDLVRLILGDTLEQNYVIAPGVTGQATFSTVKPISKKQAMGVLEMLLGMNGQTVIFRDGRYIVMPIQGAVQGNLAPKAGGIEVVNGYEIRVVPLKYIAATEMEKLLQPYARQGSILKADNPRSLIVVGGTEKELKNYLDTIQTFDVDWIAGMSFGMYELERVEAKTIEPELTAIFSDPQSSPLAGMVKLIPIERLNAIMVITPQPRYLAEVEKWIRKLDRASSEGGSQLYVYDVKNVKATDLADRLNEIFNGQAAAPRQQNNRGNLAPGLQGREIGVGGGLNNNKQGSAFGNTQPLTPQPTPVSSASGSGGGQPLLEGGDVRITAVEENNSLLVKASASQYDSIKNAIRRLDIEPLQIHIEARILEVSLNNDLQFGVSWYLDNLAGTAPAGTGIPTFNRARTTWRSQGGSIVNGAASFILDGPGARALTSFLQSEKQSKVISSPSIVVLNNKQAQINVGKQIPTVSSFFNPGTTQGTTGSSGSVQFRDTGTTLSVTPRANPGGLVFMEIQQEQSQPDGPADATGNVPVSQKTISTEVAVQSGKTLLLGGLIQQTQSSGNDGVPGLKNIPIIGRLFGRSTKGNNRTELLVLITPTVIEGGGEQAEAITNEYMSRLKGLDVLIKDEKERREAADKTSALLEKMSTDKKSKEE
jgi:general secretion pathway protein D